MKTGMIFGLAIVALVGAVAVLESSGFTTLLSSSDTGPSVDRSEPRVSSAAPVQQPEAKQPGAIEPVPAPPAAQLPAPPPPAPVSNDATTSAQTAPSAPAGGRVTAADVLVPDAESGARTALTAQEKDAIARGLKELGLTATSATPSAQSEEAATAELNRKALADGAAAEARAKQLQAQTQK